MSDEPELEQLRLDGGADPIVKAASKVGRAPAQVQILRAMRERGTLQAWEAGVIMHALRYSDRTCHKPKGKGTKGCCIYCSSDGSQALKLLLEHGLVERVSHKGGAYKISESKTPPAS